MPGTLLVSCVKKAYLMKIYLNKFYTTDGLRPYLIEADSLYAKESL